MLCLLDVKVTHLVIWICIPLDTMEERDVIEMGLVMVEQRKHLDSAIKDMMKNPQLDTVVVELTVRGTTSIISGTIKI